ncbi:MAG: class I SAM-dependent methyltransferase [Minisyncoccia bacterium]
MNNTRAVVTYLSKYISGNTLDFGAGSAKYRNIIAPHTSKYTTFDVIGGENIDIVGDAHKPPFIDKTFDTVISTQMLEHVERPWVIVGEIKRILKPGGICIITAPFMIPYHADPHDFFRYTKEGLGSLFKNEKFEILESGSYGKAPSVLAEMIHFSFFSHYKILTGRKNLWRSRVMRILKALGYKLDTLVSGKVIYANVYVVARIK